jgi:hypothetical protein
MSGVNRMNDIMTVAEMVPSHWSHAIPGSGSLRRSAMALSQRALGSQYRQP